MSREYLTDVLNKFAQVTSILVETSNIKEYLDSKCEDDHGLNMVLERTKTEVDNLCHHSALVNDLFYKQYKEVSKRLNSVNHKKGNEDPVDVNCNQSEQEKPQEAKPLIKLVDINKLVEPKTLPQAPPRYKRNTNLDSTVVIITSSDEEAPKNLRTKAPSPVLSRSRRKAARETVKKTRLALKDNNTSDSDFTDSGKAKTRVRNGRGRAKLDDKVTLSDTPSSLSDVAPDSDATMKVQHASKKKDKVEVVEPDWKKDDKFNSKCYVKVLRIPCEKLKEYYLDKLELLEIKKLSDINSLKRKKGKKSDSDRSSDEQQAKKKKKSKKVVNEDEEESVGNEDDEDDDKGSHISTNDVELNSNTQNREKELAADDAMAILASDKDDENEASEEEENTEAVKSTNKENQEKASSKETEADLPEENGAEKEEKQETDNTAEHNSTEEGVNENRKDNEAQNENSKDETDKDDEDEKNKKNDEDESKKKWRKNKLLTQKLSSSDSEEEFQKFCRKKDKMQQEVTRLVKKRLKKTILLDSDSDKKSSGDEFQKSSSSSSSKSEESAKEEEEEEKKKKSRKRVKRIRDSSDEDDDDEKSTRKQIRHILGRDSLAETTKQAEAEERERKARILEKQKKYNQIYEGTYEPNATVDKVVLDFDEKNNKELLRIDDEVVKKLKPHQASGIQFMWDACFESLKRTKETKGSGCILAHCMGLGKTLQVIALSHALLINAEETGVRKVMVVSPLNTILNWVSEYRMWLPDNDDFEIYELVSFKQNYERMYQVKNWHNCGGVLIIGYDMFRNLSNPDNKRISKSMRHKFQEALVDPGPDLVICDEGHLLKNEKTNLSIAMNRLKTMRRIVLTGTPLQNNLKEYFCMVQFVKPNLLGTYREYLNRFVNPIINGQYTDSTPHDIQVMRKRSHVLHKMLDGVVQRRDYSVLQPYLPPKHEYVLFLNLTEVQIKLYRHYMEHYARRSTDGSNRTSFLFVDWQAFQRICTHPRVLLDKSIEMRNARDKMDLLTEEEDSEGSLKDFIDDEESASSTHSSSSDDDVVDDKKKKSNQSNRRHVTRAQAAKAKENGEEDPIEIPSDMPLATREWWQDYCDGDELNVITHSNKLFLLFEILKECEQIGDKVLVFSQSLYSLNIIEYFLGRVHDASQSGNTDSPESWCLGLDYFRLDGSSSCDNRGAWCKTFNDPTNTRARLFLISTKAGGLGINLVAANRVIIFDVSWNPSHDVQSIYRIYRFGQTKPCYVYRFVTNGTMEMKIYERQVTKQAISKRVIDEQQIDRHYNQNDLAELYRFDPSTDDRPTPLVPKDVLLGELLQKFEDKIYKYHEHQSLLENKEEEGLNEEERKAAWEEFENEKKQRINSATANYLRQSNNMELALISIIRKENPTWSDTQIKAMIPTLQLQLHDQIAQGDLSLYRQVQQELQIIHALQNQRLKEQFYQQQALKLMQQQQMANAAMQFQSAGSYMDQFINQNIPGTSGMAQAKNFNSNEIIDLND